MSDPIVPIRTLLRPATYRALEVVARERDTTVGSLLSLLADRAVAPPAPKPRPAPADRQPKRPDVDWTPDLLDRLRALNAARVSDTQIARQLSLPQPSVSRQLRSMGCPSPYARPKR